jgi:hypothetical protein
MRAAGESGFVVMRESVCTPGDFAMENGLARAAEKCILRPQREDRSMRHFKALKLGLAGLTVAALINGVALGYFDVPSSRWFSNEWWTTWFPGYSVWVVLVLVGIGQRFQKRPE